MVLCVMADRDIMIILSLGDFIGDYLGGRYCGNHLIILYGGLYVHYVFDDMSKRFIGVLLPKASTLALV